MAIISVILGLPIYPNIVPLKLPIKEVTIEISPVNDITLTLTGIGFNPLHSLIVDQQEQLHFAEMELIASVKVEEELVLIMVV